jgi:hypothetical protein
VDTNRIGSREPILILTRAADRLVSLKPGEVIRAHVAEVFPGGDVNLRIQGNLFRARSLLQLPENANVLFRVQGQKAGENASEIRLQFLEVISSSAAGQTLGSPGTSLLQTLTQELAANLAVKTQMPSGLAGIVERLLKALPDDSSRIPTATREQLLNLLQTSLRATGQSIQDRVKMLFGQVFDQEALPLPELAGVKERVFADIEKILQVPLKSTLENTGVGLEGKLRALAEALMEAGDRSLRNPLSALGTAQSAGTTPVPPDLKAGLLQIREMLLEQQEQLSSLAMRSGAADTTAVGDKKTVLEQMLQSVDGLLQDIESFQLLSKLTDSFYTFLPFIWDGLKEAEIAFKRSGRGPQSRSYYCLVHLNLEELGKLEIVAMMTGPEFYVSFKSDHDKFRSVLNAHLSELRQMFAAKGLKLALVSFYRMEEKQLAPFERLESFESIINIKI